MATGWKGIATGALALLALETVLQPQASGRLGDLLALPARWANRFLDPSVPALHKGTAPAAPGHPTGAVGDFPAPGTTPTPRAPHLQGIPTN